jgi:hypothetical protein
MRLLILSALVLFCESAWAGGTAFLCHYESLTDDGKGTLLLTLRAIETPDVAVTFVEGRQLIFHIKYSAHDPLPSGHPPVSRPDFDAAVARIRADLNAGTNTRFGVLGAALRPIKGHTGHYQIYGLRLEDEGGPNGQKTPLVVYAY